MLPPIIRMTPKSADRMGEAEHRPGQTGPGSRAASATFQKAFHGEARNVAAASSGRSPMAAKALRIGCTTNGIAEMIEPMTRPVKREGERARAPRRGDRSARAVRSERDQQ